MTTSLVTSEDLYAGKRVDLFLGGACNLRRAEGLMRNTGRDELEAWLDSQGWTYYDPQIHPSTHGREYDWARDSEAEKQARAMASLRVYEIIPETLGATTMLEIFDDAVRQRPSVVWLDGAGFTLSDLGQAATFKADEAQRSHLGPVIHGHLLDLLKTGERLRKELRRMLADNPHIRFADSLDQVKSIIGAHFHTGSKASTVGEPRQ